MLIKDKSRIWTILFTAYFIGLLTHGYIIFNKISLHDDAFCMYQLGGTVTIGRWALEIIQQFLIHTIGVCSIPVVGGGGFYWNDWISGLLHCRIV